MSTFNTEALKKMVSYAIQGAGFNKLLELSTLIGIRVENGDLYLNTTDGTNHLSVSGKCVADDMDITVNAELFSKLIGKINSDTVDMDIIDNTLVVRGNGKYTLELVLDENGDMLSFPDKFPKETTEIGKISASDLVVITNTVKASLSPVAGSVYSSYYFGDLVAGTDKAMLSIFKREVFDTPYLINKEFVDLMNMGLADVTLSKSDNMLVADIDTDGCSISICTTFPSNISDFNIEGVNKFAALEVNSFCRFKKAQMLELLDRLSLFVSKFDDGAIELHFTQDYIEVSSMASNGIESVDITEFKDAKDLTIKINIDRFRNQLKAYNSDMVDLYYGNEICIKLVDGDITQVIALIK